MIRDPLGLIYDLKTGQLVYSGFDTKEMNKHYNEDPRNRMYLVHTLYYTKEQCEKDPGIHTEVKNKEVKDYIDCSIKLELLKHLIKDDDR